MNHESSKSTVIDTALTALRGFGIEAEVVRHQSKSRGTEAEALIRVRHGDQEIQYAAHVKRGLRPALLGAVILQLERLVSSGRFW